MPNSARFVEIFFISFPLLVDKTAKIQDFIEIYTPSKKLFLDELDHHELGEDICQIE